MSWQKINWQIFFGPKLGQSKGCGPVDGRVQKFGRTSHGFYTPYWLQHAAAWHWLDLNWKSESSWWRMKIQLWFEKNHSCRDLSLGPPTTQSAALPSVLSHYLYHLLSVQLSQCFKSTLASTQICKLRKLSLWLVPSHIYRQSPIFL